MDSPAERSSASPERGKLPLRPVSPSRENRRPTSPSLPSISPTRTSHDRFASSHTRSGSDVQNKVAAFNNLTREAAQRRKDNEAALKRATLGREEAENEARRLKEENDVLRRSIEDGRGRERKVGERLESMMEELQRTKEVQVQAQSLYEKEVRRARKEAFKSSSALVNLQEELKTARNRYTLMRVDAEDYKMQLVAKEEEFSAVQQQQAMMQEEMGALKSSESIASVSEKSQPLDMPETSFEEQSKAPSRDVALDVSEPNAAQTELRELSEELFILQQKLGKAERKVEKAEMQKQVAEEERDFLKKNMEEEQVARSAAQGEIALPSSRDTFGPSERGDRDEPENPKHGEVAVEGALNQLPDYFKISKLKEELDGEKRRRFEAEELVHFSQMECQFGCCSCRRAEQKSTLFVHDDSFAAVMAALTTATCLETKKEMKTAISGRPRHQPSQARSATPKAVMPQRPQSQQARTRHASPKLLERPRSQQAAGRTTTPRPFQHNRSVTETTFRTARELDSQARRSISHARNSSATPRSQSRSRDFLDELLSPKTQAKAIGKEATLVNEGIIDADNSSPWPKPPMTDHSTYLPVGAPSLQHIQPPSPTMELNFTEIIPSIPTVPRSLPTPPTPVNENETDDLFGFDSLKNESTTVTIPLKNETPETSTTSPEFQGSISREEALAQIRARRGRARSFAASHVASTPKRGITGTPRREISAPSLKRI